MNTRLFGSPVGAPGVDVLERSSGNALSDPNFGAVAYYGVMKRGEPGVAIPIRSRREYDEIFGDPSDPTWHLDRNGAHLVPDAVDGFLGASGGSGTIWLTRLDLDGKARAASVVLKNRFGADALRISAANPGRWGGQAAEIGSTAVLFATSRTFTLVAPGTEANEFLEADASFSSAPGKRYIITGNTAASASGEVVFTVADQYNLFTDGISGPVALAGTASYQRFQTLTGSIQFPLLRNLSGTAALNGTVITGTGTSFLADLYVGANVYVAGEARAVQSITSDTTLTVNAAFTAQGSSLTLQADNLTVTGTTTEFLEDLNVGDTLYANVQGQQQGRVIANIVSDTELVLESGFTQALSAGTQAQKINLTVTGTTTAFTTELQVGQFLIDPSRPAAFVQITAIDSAISLTIASPFGSNFAATQLTRQNQTVSVALSNSSGQGLSVEIGQGLRYPESHFSLLVRFNGNQVVNIPDASLDPLDPQGLFVEPLVNDSNISYRVGSQNYQKYIKAESLWTSEYTTNPATDCRPCNGAGQILAISTDTLWTSALMDYTKVVGQFVYPNPYTQPRGFFRVKSARAPLTLEGTISSSGVVVTGTGTTFLTSLQVGDYLYIPHLNVARKVRLISSNTSLTLDSAFASNLPSLTVAGRSGHIKVDQGYDLTRVAQQGDRFLVVYPTELAGGYDGDTATLIPFHFTKYADIDRNHLENAVFGRNQGLIRMATPGISDISTQQQFARYASAKAYEYRCEIPSTFTSASAAESFVINSIGRDDFITVAFPSYGFISNPLGAGERMITLSGEIMGGESRKANQVQGYHAPFAGISAFLSRITRLPYESSPSDEAILNLAGIQPIKYLDGRAVVFGARSPSLSPTYDFTHIRRIQSNYVRIFLEARTMLEMIFSPNQPELVDQIVMLLNNFARREYRKGVMTNYLSFDQAVQIQGELGGQQGVISDVGSVDALVQIINGKLKVFFRYVPTGILERLTIDAGPDILVAQFGNTITQQTGI